MRRETSRQYIVDLIQRIRAGIPQIALRTTFIVGFPGESEPVFESLLEFIRETKFERLGVFAYSKQDGTRAGAMSGQIPERVKQKRRARAMAEQQKIARAVGASFVGRTLNVLMEGVASERQLDGANVISWEHGLMRSAGDAHSKPEFPVTEERESGSRRSILQRGNTRTWCVGRGEADAPDIDGRIYVRGKMVPGEFIRVKIIGHTDYDLIAEPAA
jgi:ribosomal protein S12 methylthiotransferase